jgi:UDP-glucose 4-epimerase
MRIVVTGGAGFIGSHVADGFIAAGHEVAVLDTLATGDRAKVNPRARFYQLDVRDRQGVAAMFAEFRPELVDHHAAQAEVPKSVADPVFDAEVNVLGGLNLLRAALDHGVRKVVFASTGGALYGDPERVPCDEEHPIRPLSPYGTSKYCFEQYLGTFRRTFGLDFTVLRYANVYGPRQDFLSEEGRVVAIFASRMLRGQPVTVDGDGEQSRDMVFVSDVVAANLAALEHGSGAAFNVGTGRAVTINQIFDRLRHLTGYQLEPRHGPARRGDVYRIALDCAKAERELGWRAAVGLEEGLRRTVDYFRTLEPGG